MLETPQVSGLGIILVANYGPSSVMHNLLEPFVALQAWKGSGVCGNFSEMC